MKKHYPRFFVGLDLDKKAKLAIEQWRHKYLSGLSGKPVPVENFHITLSFLGAVPPEKHELLIQLLESISAHQFSTVTSQLGSFKKAKVLYLGVKNNPAIDDLAFQCRKVNKHLNVPQHHSHFKPHITLFRKHDIHIPINAPKLDLTLHFEKIHLFESVSNAQMGKPPVYHKRRSFKLLPNIKAHS